MEFDFVTQKNLKLLHNIIKMDQDFSRDKCIAIENPLINISITKLKILT